MVEVYAKGSFLKVDALAQAYLQGVGAVRTIKTGSQIDPKPSFIHFRYNTIYFYGDDSEHTHAIVEMTLPFPFLLCRISRKPIA